MGGGLLPSSTVSGFTSARPGHFNRENVTFDISPGHFQCGDSNLANELKKGKAVGGKNGLCRVCVVNNPLHASCGSFLFMLFLRVYIISFCLCAPPFIVPLCLSVCINFFWGVFVASISTNFVLFSLEILRMHRHVCLSRQHPA